MGRPGASATTTLYYRSQVSLTGTASRPLVVKVIDQRFEMT